MNKFKIKHRGMKITVRPMAANEVIDDRTLMVHKEFINDDDLSNPNIRWTTSNCIGEKVGDHPDFAYIKVLSSFY